MTTWIHFGQNKVMIELQQLLDQHAIIARDCSIFEIVNGKIFSLDCNFGVWPVLFDWPSAVNCRCDLFQSGRSVLDSHLFFRSDGSIIIPASRYDTREMTC
jgi:hypothetical protein